MARCIIGTANVTRCVVGTARAANVAGSVVVGATGRSACVLIFFSHAARMTDPKLRAVTPVVTGGIISAPATAATLSGRAITGRGAAAAGAAT